MVGLFYTRCISRMLMTVFLGFLSEWWIDVAYTALVDNTVLCCALLCCAVYVCVYVQSPVSSMYRWHLLLLPLYVKKERNRKRKRRFGRIRLKIGLDWRCRAVIRRAWFCTGDEGIFGYSDD